MAFGDPKWYHRVCLHVPLQLVRYKIQTKINGTKPSREHHHKGPERDCPHQKKPADSIGHLITTVLVKTHKWWKSKLKPGRVCSLTRVCEAAQGTPRCWCQGGCLQCGTPPWLGSGTGGPAAATSSPYFSPPAGGWCAEGRSTACGIFDSHNVEKKFSRIK